ncbi:MAG: YciI family protein [Chthoniobacter sp.]
MQFMMLMIPAVYQGGKTVDPGFVPDPEKIEEMGKFNDELGKALKIISINGLHPQNTGARVSFAGGKPSVTDGPYIETKEVIGGYWLVEAESKEEVLKWVQRCPADPGDVIEIRQVFELADFAVKR